MIGRLSGEVLHLESDHLILDVNGVGYLIYCSMPVLNQLSPGKHAVLWTEMEVKQEQIMLFGFTSLDEKRWFKVLQSVQGVGAKVALAILGVFTPSNLTQAITGGDKSAFQKVSGVGPKLATRLVTELRDKAIALSPHISHNSGEHGNIEQSGYIHNQLLQDATSALINFGFHRNDVYTVLKSVIEENNELELSELIRIGLTVLGSNK